MQESKQTENNSSHWVLSEYESKKMLADYGIPVSEEILIQNRDQAVAAAKKIGFPVVLKACSPELMHKSEAGCVELSLTSDDDVADAYDRIVSSVAGAISGELEGVLVAEMVSGARELVLGLTREPQFGPCVMIGLGGVMTEIFKDTVFRVAPFDQVEAEDMISELKSRAMLDEFRGEHPADMKAICQCLISLGKIGLENPDISEIDINPLKIGKDGRVTAVDALIIFEPESRS
jgi:succinyl-CoA synthetase beta subunit